MPLKFRCYRCNQLLGASRSKVGTVISCPKCGSALVVPEPEDESAAPVAHSVKPALGVLAARGPQAPDADSVFDIRPEDIRVEPGIEILTPEADDTPDADDEPEEVSTGLELHPEFVPPEPAAPPDEPGLREAPPHAPRLVTTPPIQVEPSRVDRLSEPSSRIRARDVVLPRSVVLLWSLFVLLALALAFSAGLLAGHYVWRVHEPVGRLNVAPGPK